MKKKYAWFEYAYAVLQFSVKENEKKDLFKI